MRNLKLFEQFSEDDPFGEETRFDPDFMPIERDTKIEIGDKIYTIDFKYIGKIMFIEDFVDSFGNDNVNYKILIGGDPTFQAMIKFTLYQMNLNRFKIKKLKV